MDIRIEPILIEQKSVFSQLMELCNYEFSEYEDSDLNEYGYYGYSHIDDYWNECGRFPYFIRVNGKLAGFALVTSRCHYLESPDAHNIAEFFVMIKYRRKGVGRFVAKEVFNKHKGMWEVLQIPTNIRAQKFWKSVIDEYTNGAYEECGSINDQWIGFLFGNL